MNLVGNQHLINVFTQTLIESDSLTQEFAQYCHQLEEQLSTCTTSLRDQTQASQRVEAHTKQQMAALDASPDAVALLIEEQMIYANPKHLQLFGYTDPEQLLGKPWQILYPEDEAQRIEADILPILHQDRQWRGETYAQRLNGEAFIAEVTFSLDPQAQMVCIWRDVTDRVYAESWQATQTAVLKQLATGTPTLEVLEAIMGGLDCHLMGGKGAILLADESQQLRHGIAPNLPIAFTDKFGSIAIEANGGTCSKAAYTKRPVITSDLKANPPCPDLACISIEQDLQSCWAFPILDSKTQVLGVMAIYFMVPRVPSDPERKFIDIAVDLASLALEQNQVKFQQEEDRAEMFLANAELQAIFDTFPDKLLRIDDSGTILSYKGGIPEDQRCLAPEMLLGKNIQTLFSAEISAQILDAITQVLVSNKMQQVEYTLSIAGETRYFETRLLPAEKTQVLALVRDISDRKRAELALSGLFQGTSKVTGADFFPILVQQISSTLNIPDVKLCRLVGEELVAIAVCSGGEMQPNVSYPIANSPCEITLRDGFYSCVQGVQAAFPDNQNLIQWQSEGYIGFVLRNSAGESIGVLCCLSQHPIQEIEFTYSVLQIFGARAAAELERLQAIEAQEQLNIELEERVRSRTQALKQSEQDLRTILNTAYDGIYIHNHQGQLIDVNQRVLDFHSLSREQVLKLNLAELTTTDSHQQFQHRYDQANQGIRLQFEEEIRNFQNPSQSISVEMKMRKIVLNGKSVFISTLSDISSRKRQQQALQSIVEGTADKTGADFYQACVRYLAEIFQVRSVFLAELKDENLTQSNILALWTGDSFAPPHTIELAETPCLQTYEQEWCIIPHSLQSKFPQASQLVMLEGESYISVRIKDSQGQILGNLGIIDDQPLPLDTSNLQFVLQLFATRVGAEMDRQASEDSLRRSQQQLQTFIDNSPAAIFLKDLEGRYLIFNRVLGELFNIDPKNFLGKTDFDLFPDNIAEMLRENDASIVSQGQAQTIEEVVTHADGSRHTYIANKFPLVDDQGHIYALGGVSTDISDRKHAEEKLEESQQLLRLVIDNIPQLIYWKDHDSVYLGCNQNFAKSLGLDSPEQVIGKTDTDLVAAKKSLLGYRHDDQRILASGQPEFHAINISRTEEGRKIWMDTNKIPLKDVFDNTVGILGTYEDISDRKQTEAALQNSEQRFRQLFDGTPMIAMQVYDKERRVVDWNQASENFYGYTRSEALGQRLEDLIIPPYMREGVIQGVSDWVKFGRAIPAANLDLRNKNGEGVSVFSSHFMMDNAEGEPELYCLDIDLREQKATELALRQKSCELEQTLSELTASKQLLELVFNTLPQRVFWKDRDLIYLGCNQHFLRDAGMETQEQMIGKTDYDLPWPEQADSFRADDALVIHSGVPRINYEEEQVRENGEISWVRTSKIPLRNAENEIIGVFGSYEDITQLKEAEHSLKRINEELEHRVVQRTKELEDSQQLLQLVMDTIPQSIFWKDRDFRFLGCNQSFLLTTGLTSIHELIGKTDYEMPWQGEADHYRGCDQRIIEAQSPELGIVESLPQTNGQTIWLETNKAPLYNAQGDLMGILGTFHDITQRKQAEEALQELNTELQAAKELADTANRAKSEFLANMSHELRTPLNGILGYAQILKRDSYLLAHHTKGLEIINQSGEHLLTLINDILDIAKIEARKLELLPTDVHLPTVLNNIVDIMRMRVQEKDIHFVYTLDEHLPLGLQADEKRLRQVLLNLLSNAIKFTDQGLVTFTVGLEQQTSEQAILKFAITDTGIGIAPEHIEHIFNPFEQVGALHRRAEGTGLGLAITRQLIELMGGHLQLSSCLGQGSTFWFTVPFSISHQVIPSKRTKLEPIVGYSGPRRRLLIIDDSALNRSVLISMLEPLGFDIELAEDGQLGLERTQQIRPDLILTDLVMPNMDGLTMIHSIRQIPELQSIPIIAISASVQELSQHKSQEAGCDAFIAKPIEEAALFNLLATYLQLEWICAPSIPANTSPPPPPHPRSFSNLKLFQKLEHCKHFMSWLCLVI